MPIDRFSANTVSKIGYYVYGLRDPVTDDYFYIGKGKGNRVFSHIKQKVRRGIKDPKYDTIRSLEKYGGPKVDIIRHGLTENESLLLESALIDVFGVNQITNKKRGIDSSLYGKMSAELLEEQYKGKRYTGKIPAVCFKINKRWNKDITESDLYDSIRASWRLNIKRAERAKIGIGVKDGIIRGIYEIKTWEYSEDRKRYQFIGARNDKLDRFRGYTVDHLPQHAVRGPLFYINC